MKTEKEELLEELETAKGIQKKILDRYRKIYEKTGVYHEEQINKQLDRLNELNKLEKQIKEK